MITQRRLPEFGGLWWPPQCEACNEALAEEEREREARRARMREMERANLAHQRLMASGLPAPYLNGRRGPLDLDAGPDTDGYRAARMAFARLITGQLRDERSLPIPWIYLHGPNGTHKSTLLCCTVLELIHLGKRAKYLLWPEALDELRALHRDDAAETVSEYVKRLVEVPHLAVDEIGLGTPTPFAAEKLFIVLERRYQEDSAADAGDRSTMFTSNRSLAELVQTFAHLDDGLAARRLARRIGDMASEIHVAG
ncbi:MAG TPA: ATP-binding protein [Thermoanaerobaculia bacterium]|nr:ATP-binding protein [Thermoanaerobaculia bacterium]